MSGVPLGPAALADLYAAELPQKDQLCGAFWGSLALRALGVSQVDGEPVDQDLVGRAAGSTLAAGDPAEWVPSGASPRGDYRLDFEVAEDEATSGTASDAVAEAIASLSGASLRAVPVAGPWSGERVVTLLEELEQLGDEVVVIANVNTGGFWGARPDPAVLLDVLAGRTIDNPPAPDWSVGHFVGIAVLLRGPGGAIVGVRDTYPALGLGGYHLQPAQAVAAALRRDDGVGGGILFVTSTAHADRLEPRLRSLGFELRHWDNGSVPVYRSPGTAPGAPAGT